MNAKILVADKLSKEGIRLLESTEGVEVVVRHGMTEDEFAEAAAGVDAILVRSAAKVTARILAAADRLRVVGRAGIGVDNIDVAGATARGVLVMNVPDANADTTAEHAITLLVALARNLPTADRSLRAGNWERSKFLGSELQGKVLGIIGGGNIGRRVASRARGLGMEVVVHDPFLPPDALKDLHVAVVSMDELCARADFITLHTPLLDATRHLVDADFLSRVKPNVRIVNCARGGIVDEAALVDALREGRIRGAALDVFETEPPPKDHPLFEFENVVVTPHLGASTSEAQTRASVDLCRQVLDYLDHGEARNALNLPRTPPELLSELAPWTSLAGRLGLLLAGLLDGPAERLDLSYRGTLAELETGTVTRAFVAGLLRPAFDTPVNLVNALQLAGERGLAVEERKRAAIRDFAAMITGTATIDGKKISVSGALFGHRQPRIVKIDGFHLEAIPEGSLLVVRNEDRPGTLGRIGSILGDAGVNIKAMHLAPPRAEDGHALGVVNVEPDVDAATLDAIRALPEVRRVAFVRLDGEPGVGA